MKINSRDSSHNESSRQPVLLFTSVCALYRLQRLRLGHNFVFFRSIAAREPSIEESFYGLSENHACSVY